MERRVDPGGLSRLILGTAQFAGAYGIVASAKPASKLEASEPVALLAAAQAAGVTAVDTARAYGRAEEEIGASIWQGEVWTKLDPTFAPEESVTRSLTALRRSHLDVLYVHDVGHFLQLPRSSVRQIEGLRGTVVTALGVSAYEPGEVARALELIDFDVVQLPSNPFDTRLKSALEEGSLPRDCRYVGRSVFLQGLLAQPALAEGRVPKGLRPAVTRWRSDCEAMNVAPGEASLVLALSLPFLDRIIVGADSVRQLEEILTWTRSPRSPEILERLSSENLWPLSDPRTWDKPS